MKICVKFALCIVVYITGVVADPDNEVKRGIFPFMAFIYYQDASVIDESGVRFSRAATLIRSNWLLSGSLDRNNAPLAFPQKTLLARLGAVNIDANFNFNEDEEEQEREIIQIIQPYDFNTSQWWYYDISLLKTLLPFNISTVITPITPSYKQDFREKSCKILVYARRFDNATEDKILMQLSVELLSPAKDCDVHFKPDTMICGSDSDDNKNFNYESEFCHGNAGGPLLCEGEVTGLQTYVNDNCKQPRLFQLLSAWEKLITCTVEEKCQEDHCNNTCTIINKDTPINEIVVPVTDETKVILVSQSDVEIPIKTTISSTVTESIPTEIILTESIPTEIILTESIQTESVQETESVPETDKILETSETSSPTLTTIIEEQKIEAPSTTTDLVISKLDEEETTTWTASKIKEKPVRHEQKEESENIERKPNVEAQQKMVLTGHSVSYYTSLSQNLLIYLLIIIVIISH